jgi:hypothetical protein
MIDKHDMCPDSPDEPQARNGFLRFSRPLASRTIFAPILISFSFKLVSGWSLIGSYFDAAA